MCCLPYILVWLSYYVQHYNYVWEMKCVVSVNNAFHYTHSAISVANIALLVSNITSIYNNNTIIVQQNVTYLYEAFTPCVYLVCIYSRPYSFYMWY